MIHSSMYWTMNFLSKRYSCWMKKSCLYRPYCSWIIKTSNKGINSSFTNNHRISLPFGKGEKKYSRRQQKSYLNTNVTSNEQKLIENSNSDKLEKEILNKSSVTSKDHDLFNISPTLTLTRKQINEGEFIPRKSIQILRALSKFRKFDPSVDVSVELNLDPRKNDQILRSFVELPYGHGKKRVRVIVFTNGEEEENIAKEAGATVVGSDKLIAKIKSKKLKLKKQFDKILCTSGVLNLVKKELSKILGAKGILPSSKFNTVVEPSQLAQAVEAIKHKRINLNTGRTPVINGTIGRISWSDEKILQNFRAFMIALQTHKPFGAKGKYIRKISLNFTMSPAVTVDKKYADPTSPFFMKNDQF